MCDAVEDAFAANVDYAMLQKVFGPASARSWRTTRRYVALHYMHYNFCRVHKTLRVTPAMEAGLATHVSDIEEIVGLLEAAEREPAA